MHGRLRIEQGIADAEKLAVAAGPTRHLTTLSRQTTASKPPSPEPEAPLPQLLRHDIQRDYQTELGHPGQKRLGKSPFLSRKNSTIQRSSWVANRLERPILGSEQITKPEAPCRPTS